MGSHVGVKYQVCGEKGELFSLYADVIGCEKLLQTIRDSLPKTALPAPAPPAQFTIPPTRAEKIVAWVCFPFYACLLLFSLSFFGVEEMGWGLAIVSCLLGGGMILLLTASLRWRIEVDPEGIRVHKGLRKPGSYTYRAISKAILVNTEQGKWMDSALILYAGGTKITKVPSACKGYAALKQVLKEHDVPFIYG